MKNPVLDLRTPNRALSPAALQQLVIEASGIAEPIGKWVIYVSGRRWDASRGSLRPRSQVSAFFKEAPLVSIRVVWSNKELIVVHKPQGLPTQKTLKRHEENLYDQVRLWRVQQEGFPVWLPYVGLHHRLDRDTSGLVLMTLQKSANPGVAELFREGKIQKTYLAYTTPGPGAPKQKSWSFSGKIGRVAGSKQFRFCVTDKGDEAHSRFTLLESRPGSWHLIACEPLTGRTHQLRVHLAHQGWSILGDPLYGPRADKAQSPQGRLYLHAQRLRFQWRGQDIVIENAPDWTPPTA